MFVEEELGIKKQTCFDIVAKKRQIMDGRLVGLFFCDYK